LLEAAAVVLLALVVEVLVDLEHPLVVLLYL
jgi:hypothetical protein